MRIRAMDKGRNVRAGHPGRAAYACRVAGFGLAYLALAEAGRRLSDTSGRAPFAIVRPPSGLHVATLFLARRQAGSFAFSALVANLADFVLLRDRRVSQSLAILFVDGQCAGMHWRIVDFSHWKKCSTNQHCLTTKRRASS
jgi:hypothetical protein